MKIKPYNYRKWMKPTHQLPNVRTASLVMPSSCQSSSSSATHGQDNSYSNEGLLEDHIVEEIQEDDVVIHTEELESVPIIQEGKNKTAKGKLTKKKDADLKKEFVHTKQQFIREIIQRRNMAGYLTVMLQQKMNLQV